MNPILSKSWIFGDRDAPKIIVFFTRHFIFLRVERVRRQVKINNYAIRDPPYMQANVCQSEL